MSFTIGKTLTAGMLAALFAGSAVAGASTPQATAPGHFGVQSSSQERIEQNSETRTQAEERLQQRLNAESGQGEQAQMRHEYREQHFETYREQSPMQSRPMGH